MSTMNECQAVWDARMPEDDVEPDCGGMFCGLCEKCIDDAWEAYVIAREFYRRGEDL